VDPSGVAVACEVDSDEGAEGVRVDAVIAMADDGPVDVFGDDQRSGCGAECLLHAGGVEEEEGDIEGFAETSVAVVVDFSGVHDDTHAELAARAVGGREAGVVVGRELAECRDDLVEQDWFGGLVDWVDEGEEAVAAVGEPVTVAPADARRLQRRELGDRHFEAFGLINLGEALCRQDRYQQAEDHLGRALAIFREFGNRRGEAYALQNPGHVLQGQARYQQAAGFHRQALALFREIGDRSTEAASLNSLGEALSGAGLHGPARAQHDDALAVACQIGDRYEQARAHNGIASSHHAVGDPGQARHHWQQALNLYAELGAPEADHVRAQLSTAHDDGDSES
jgi:tetratricopeptide (TPR) repeat protein